jgi:hypothetical protein
MSVMSKNTFVTEETGREKNVGYFAPDGDLAMSQTPPFSPCDVPYLAMKRQRYHQEGKGIITHSAVGDSVFRQQRQPRAAFVLETLQPQPKRHTIPS